MKLKQKIAIGYVRAKFKMLTAISRRLAAEKAFELFCTPFTGTKTGKLPAIFEQAERLELSLQGNRVQGFRWNHPRQQRVLVLHGFSSAAHKFHTYISALAGKGYEVLAFDAPAHGSSSGRRINAVQYAQMIGSVVQQYGPITRFLAHSFGCIALSLALEKLPHAEETRVVFIAPATETTSAVEAAFRMLQLDDPIVREEFNNIIYELSGERTEWFSIKRAMKHIRARVLWVHDQEDDVTPFEDVRKVQQENFPNIQYIITSGLGHRKIYTDAGVKKQVVDFL